jgi:hypothetical protein
MTTQPIQPTQPITTPATSSSGNSADQAAFEQQLVTAGVDFFAQMGDGLLQEILQETSMQQSG